VRPTLSSGGATLPRCPCSCSAYHPCGWSLFLRKFLGEGGKKKVYLAHDTLLDRDAAIGLIETEGLDAASRSRITREAQAMGRLGSHPHIVTVFDLGDHEGQPYMVTELMRRGDLEGLIEKAPDHKLPLGKAVELVTGACRSRRIASR
jgi:serine/threonine protein kinase